MIPPQDQTVGLLEEAKTEEVDQQSHLCLCLILALLPWKYKGFNSHDTTSSGLDLSTVVHTDFGMFLLQKNILADEMLIFSYEICHANLFAGEFFKS